MSQRVEVPVRTQLLTVRPVHDLHLLVLVRLRVPVLRGRPLPHVRRVLARLVLVRRPHGQQRRVQQTHVRRHLARLLLVQNRLVQLVPVRPRRAHPRLVHPRLVHRRAQRNHAHHVLVHHHGYVLKGVRLYQ